jgi:hypothetical protein
MSGAALTPEEVAESWGWSPRRLRALIREIGAGHILGKSIVLFDEDICALKEATRLCPSRSTVPRDLESGTTAGPLMDSDYAEVQKLLSAKQRRELRRKKKPDTGNVVWMGRQA